MRQTMRPKLPTVEQIKRAIDAVISFENTPAHFAHNRNGWAGYRGMTRITRYYFTEEGAREAVIELEARGIKVQ